MSYSPERREAVLKKMLPPLNDRSQIWPKKKVLLNQRYMLGALERETKVV